MGVCGSKPEPQTSGVAPNIRTAATMNPKKSRPSKTQFKEKENQDSSLTKSKDSQGIRLGDNITSEETKVADLSPKEAAKLAAEKRLDEQRARDGKIGKKLAQQRAQSKLVHSGL